MSAPLKERARQVKLQFSKTVFDYHSLVSADAAVPVKVTDLGALWAGDCLELLPAFRDESVDTVFADPPFNLGKEYGQSCDDSRPDYLKWCEKWLSECISGF